MSFEILRMMAQEYADRHKEPQTLPATIDTLAYAYQRICQGEDPWTALGDFSNAWYGYAKHIRPERMIPTICWKCLGGICCDHMMRTHKNTSVQLHHQRLLAATSFAVTDSIKINMKCTNGFRKPSSRA